MNKILRFAKKEVLKTFLLRWAFLFSALFLLTLPFHYQLFPQTGQWLKPVTEKVAGFTLIHVFRIHTLSKALVSDSLVMYVHVFNLALIALIGSITWLLIRRRRELHLLYWFRVMARYYLSPQLFIYALGKIFPWQFYPPEANTLYTRLGQLTPDLLYWTTIGISRPYQVFMGSLELLAAFFLLFRRSTLAGALLACGILMQVTTVNFSFGITVKIYSLFLLWLSLCLIITQATALFRFLFTGNIVQKKEPLPPLSNLWMKAAKAFVILLIVSEGALLCSSGMPVSVQGDQPLSGGYSVLKFIRNNTIDSSETGWRYVFFHSRGWLITRDARDSVQDYELSYDTTGTVIYALQENGLSIPIHYTEREHELILSCYQGEDSLAIYLEKISIEKLPLLQNQFHWTNEEE